LPLGGSKDEHFSCFPTSCQIGLREATIEEEGPFKTKQVSFLFSAIQGFQSTSKKG